MLKRIFSIFAISLIITGLFFEGYSLKCPVYADETIDAWTNVTTNEQLVEAFKYYCKSRDLTIEGSVADAVTSFTTKSFNGICNTLGIDITALQGQLKYRTDGNAGLQFLFTSTGVEAYNRIFSQFLQDNELEVGDENVNKNVVNGKLFQDDEGNTCYLFSTNGTGDTLGSVLSVGTPYLYTYEEYKTACANRTSVSSKTTTIFNKTYTFTYDFYIDSQGSNLYENYRQRCRIAQSGNSSVKTVVLANQLKDGTWERSSNNSIIGVAINNSGRLFLIKYWYQDISGSTGILELFRLNDNDETNNFPAVTVNIVSTQINNNTYEGDTVINNEGDVINNYPDNPDTPDNPDLPPSNPSVPDSGGWQDFQMPTMPNDWLIYGMEKKFPFDIPFNIMFALSLLNHEPEIPKFEGDIDLKVCTWHYDIDLTPFDDIAKILRKFEVLAFIIGLAILTKELIMWG